MDNSNNARGDTSTVRVEAERGRDDRVSVKFPGQLSVDVKQIIANRTFNYPINPNAVWSLNRFLKRLTIDQEGPNPGYLFGEPGRVNWTRINRLFTMACDAAKQEPETVRGESNHYIEREKWYKYPCFSESSYYDTTAGYFTSGTVGPSDRELWEDVWSALRSDMRLKGHKIRPVSWDDALQWINRPANSGLPEFTRKGVVVDKTKGKLAGIPTDWSLPSIAGVRTQGGKNRLIQMVPFGVIAYELRYIIGFQKYVTLPWSGNVWVDPLTLDQRLKLRCPGPYFWGGDWSAYDQSINEWELASAYEQIFGNSFDWSPCVDHSMHREIITPWGVTKKRMRALASGEEHTNPLGTPMNHARLRYGIAKLGLDINPDKISCQGDDFLVSMDELISKEDIDRVSKLFRDEFKAEMNPEKQTLTHQNGVYLKRWWPGGHFFVGRVTYTLAFVERRVKHFKFGGAFEYYVTLWVHDGLERLSTCAGSEKIIDRIRSWDKFHGDPEAAREGKTPQAIGAAEEEWKREHYMEDRSRV